MVNQGDISVWSSVTQQITLPQSDELGRGGEGAVYSVGSHPDLVAKIYHPNRRADEVISKLEVMINYPPRTEDDQTGHLFVAWPNHLLYDTAQDVIGFLMPKVEKTHSLFEYYNPSLRRRTAPQIQYGNLCSVAKSLATALDRLHGSGYVVGDINESNAYITENEHVTLIDSDSFQITDYQTTPPTIYRSLVGKPEYTPPELQGVSFAQVDRNIHHDRFALAVVIYQLLMEGTHPFRGRFTGAGEPPKVESCISDGFFLHSASRTVPLRPMPAAVEWDTLHEDIRALFRKCFDDGHTDPQARPAPRDWVDALDEAMRDLKQCSRSASHFYFDKQASGSAACTWCERKAKSGIESFPDHPGAQIFVPPAQTVQPPPPQQQLPQQQLPQQQLPQQQPPQQQPPQQQQPILQSSAATIPVWVMLFGIGYFAVLIQLPSDYYSRLALYSSRLPYFLAIAALLFVTVFWRSRINSMLYRRLPSWLTSQGAVVVAAVWGVPGYRRPLWIRILAVLIMWMVLLLPIQVVSATMGAAGREVDFAVASLLFAPEPTYTPTPTHTPEAAHIPKAIHTPAPTLVPEPKSTPVPLVFQLSPVSPSASPAAQTTVRAPAPTETPTPIDVFRPTLNLVPSGVDYLDMRDFNRIFTAQDLPEGYAHEITLRYRDCLNDVGVSIDDVDFLVHARDSNKSLTVLSGRFTHDDVADRLTTLGFSMLEYQGSELWLSGQACVNDERYQRNVEAVAVLDDGHIIIGDEDPLKNIIETVKQGGSELTLNQSIRRALDESGQFARAWTTTNCVGSRCRSSALVWSASAENNALDLIFVGAFRSASSAGAGRRTTETWMSENYRVLRMDVSQDEEFIIIDTTVSFVPSEPSLTPTHTPEPPDTPLAAAVVPTNTPLPTSTPTPLPTHTPTPLPTATHTPLPTPTHTPMSCRPEIPGSSLNRCDLRGADLRGYDLTGVDLRYANLAGTDLKDAVLTGANLTDVNLTDADFTGAVLTDADMTGASVEGIILTRVDLSSTTISAIESFNEAKLQRVVFPNAVGLAGATFVDADLSHGSLVGANLESADFTGASLYRANLNQAVLTDANFRRANLKSAFLNGASLQRANLAAADFSEIYFDINPDFRGADLRNANFYKAVLNGVDFSGARLDEANFNRTELSGVMFVNANLSEAEMKDAVAQGARFNNADVSDVNFSDSDLTNANFNGANIEDARFGEANLMGANFSGTINADNAIFKETVCSDGSVSDNCYYESRLHGIRP